MIAHTETVRRKPGRPRSPACAKGHTFSPENTLVLRDGKRQCRVCNRLKMRAVRAGRRERREEERQKRLAARNSPAATFCAWAAGIFEGEGTVSICKGGRKSQTRERVSVTNVDRQLLDAIHVAWPGGRMRCVGARSKNARDAWEWSISAEAAMRFLLDITPFLVTDRVRSKLGVYTEHFYTRMSGSRDDARRSRLLAIHQQMRTLNRRGRVPEAVT